MLETNNVGWNTYSEAAPPGLSLKQEKMIDTSKKLRVKISVMESELYDFNEMTEHFLYFDSGLKERIRESYEMKIKHCKEEYEDIQDNLERMGIPREELD